jgi:hypothetical protein
MQAWYKDGLLPPDLPVRREEDTEYILLKDLRAQSVDPSQPFRAQMPPSQTSIPPSPEVPLPDASKPLLPPISLLEMPRHYGPPALFYSSRGGHSTTIVDARGRSVLKGKFIWSTEDDEEIRVVAGSRLGDVKRLEAFDMEDRLVLVAMRQGGLEALDLRDALLRPGDESRTVLPTFNPSPSSLNRRKPFVWRIGTPVGNNPSSATILSSKNKAAHGSGRKYTTGISKSPIGRSDFSLYDDLGVKDEVVFLGRKDDQLYICERNKGTFRILRLCPS